MKKLQIIGIPEQGTVVCDHPNCDYRVSANIKTEYQGYINKPCPKCGYNLLEQQDYDNSMKMIKAAQWLNRWFGWISIFLKKQKEQSTSVAHYKNGSVTIKKKS